MSSVKPVSNINQDFDPRLLLLVLVQNMVWVVTLLLVSATTAFLLIRYTQPIYQTKSIIQLTSDSNKQKSNLIEGVNQLYAEDLAKQVELLRSPVFIRRVIEKLDLDISYFNKGNIIDFEIYKQSPYSVEYEVIDKIIYSVPVYIRIKGNSAEIFYKIKNKEIKQVISLGVWTDFPEFHLKVNPDYEKLEKIKGDFYFIINDPNKQVQKYRTNLKVKVLNEAAKTIEISLEDNNPVKAADFVNGMAKEFEVFHTEKQQESANQVIAYIDRTLGLVTEKLSENEKKLSGVNRIFEDGMLLPLETDVSNQTKLLFELENAKLKLELEMQILKNLLQKQKFTSADIYEQLVILSGTETEKYLSPILNQIRNLLGRKEDIAYNVTPSSKAFEAIDYQIKIQQDALIQSTQTIQEVYQNRLNTITENISRLRSAIMPQVPGAKGDTSNIELAKLRRIQAINEKYYNSLIDKRTEYMLAREGYVPEYQILQYAVSPEQPIAPNRQIIILSSLAGWLILSLMLVLVRYLFYDEILSAQDIAKHTQAPILGIIHKYKEEIPISQLVIDKKPKGLIAEAFRAVRSNMQFLNNDPGPKIISVTSTISGEGKTFITMNLAGILAFTGSRVILLDCDLRKPKIHLGFETDNYAGVSTILSHQTSLDQCIKSSKLANLDFITAGPPPPNPSELLLSQAMSTLLEDLKRKYDYVVIDNPPVGIVSDAISNLIKSDFPIYVFRSEYSRKFFINNLNRLLEESKISKMSVILNGIDLQKAGKYGYSYSYNYGYGYNYGYSYGYSYGYGFDYSGYGYTYGYGYYDKEKGMEKKEPFLTRMLKLRKKKNTNGTA